jgi:hypothetical protein
VIGGRAHALLLGDTYRALAPTTERGRHLLDEAMDSSILGGVPREGSYCNMKFAVDKV